MCRWALPTSFPGPLPCAQAIISPQGLTLWSSRAQSCGHYPAHPHTSQICSSLFLMTEAQVCGLVITQWRHSSPPSLDISDGDTSSWHMGWASVLPQAAGCRCLTFGGEEVGTIRSLTQTRVTQTFCCSCKDCQALLISFFHVAMPTRPFVE